MIKIFSVLTGAIFFTTAQAAVPVFYDIKPKASLLVDEPTPDFAAGQTYLDPAPKGVGARQAWALQGGKGENVRIIDVETAFEAQHEDLGSLFYLGNNPNDNTNHGTAVTSILRGIENSFGVIGIAFKAQLGFFGFAEGAFEEVDERYIKGINAAISGSVAKLYAGDVLVIEQHMVGPDNRKYTAVEYWQPIFDELKKATAKGIHCVQAAGNGGSNFDADIYQRAFDLSFRDSGCIMVGAAGADHERLGFSNYGSRIDAHGYGRGVTSAGYGDLFNGGVTRMYTDQFSGTSSATPIVAGSVAVVSSIAKAQGRIISPLEMRAALRATGTRQGDRSKAQRIGNLPSIGEMMNYLKLSVQ